MTTEVWFWFSPERVAVGVEPADELLKRAHNEVIVLAADENDGFGPSALRWKYSSM